MTNKIDAGRHAQAVVRLGGDPDWASVCAHYEARYEDLKEQLVTATVNQEAVRGQALAYRQILSEIRSARDTLDRLEASRRSGNATGIS